MVTLPYSAAVPIRENTLNWRAYTAPTTTTTAPPTTGAQSANLDNNSGPETYHNERSSTARVQGNYQIQRRQREHPDLRQLGAEWRRQGHHRKSVSSPTLQQVRSRLHLDLGTSEYASSMTSTCPTRCPTGSARSTRRRTSRTEGERRDCEPVAGKTPSSEYASASEQSAARHRDGTYDITWDKSTIPPRPDTVNGTVAITFPAKTLRYYRRTSDDTSSAILSGDSITNTTGVSGTDHVRCTAHER